MTSSAITPGNTTTVSTNVSVKVDNAESYSLVLSVDSSSITNGSTTLVAGNVESDNTWGYKWDNATTYSTPSTSGTTLTNSTLIPLDSNGNISFTKNLTFGAKFSNNAEAGHYKGSGTLSLVAEPKAITLGIWSNGINSGITTMQEMTPEVCNQVSTPTAVATPGGTNAPTLKLRDSRDENEYTIAKLPDGKCWMVENLRLVNKPITSTDSNVSSNYTVPPSDISKFDTTDTTQAAYYHPATDTAYYSWCAATAGTCTSATAQYKEATASICPLRWELPTGYGSESGNNDFYDLFSKMNLGVTVSASGSTSWGTSQGLAISQGSPYNFTYTGLVSSGALDYTTTFGFWWSRTAAGSTTAYRLYIDIGNVYPGTTSGFRYLGYAVRCVAEEPAPTTYRITYQLKSGDSLYGSSELPAAQEAVTTATEQAFTVQATPTINRTGVGSGCSLKNWLGSDGKTYLAGDNIVLTPSSPELILTTGDMNQGVNGCRIWEVAHEESTINSFTI